MARPKNTPQTPATMPDILPAKALALTTAQDELALASAQHDSAVRAVALQMGYQLPADCTDPDLIQRDISANMRRSVEACLEVGRGLHVLKTACAHGEFMSRLDVLRVEPRVAQKFMAIARKFPKAATSALLKAADSQSKVFEVMLLDDEQIEELELTGQSGELALDDIATMSVKDLRKAIREARANKEADDKLLADKSAKIDRLSRQIKTATPDDRLKKLQQEATGHMTDALGAIRGNVRNSVAAMLDFDRTHDGDNTVFLAGLLGQLQAELTALREAFDLPDTSSAADQALAAETAEWAFPGEKETRAKAV